MIFLYFLLVVGFLFLFLAIRIGAAASYGPEGYRVQVRLLAWSGFLGVGYENRNGTARAGPMVLGWLPWGKRLGKGGVTEPGGPDEVEKELEDADTKVGIGPPEEAEAEPPGDLDEGAKGGAAEGEKASAGEESLGEKVARIIVLAERGWTYAKSLGPAVVRFLKRLFRSVGFHHFRLEGAFGTGSPAATGKLFGYASALSANLGPRARLRLTPDFTQVRAEGEVQVVLCFYLNRLLWAVICLGGAAGLAFAKDWWRQRRRRRTAAAS